MIQNMMSQSSQCAQAKDSDTVAVCGAAHKRTIDQHCLTCKISQHAGEMRDQGSLMNGGANGGTFGLGDCIIIEHVENAHVDIMGVDAMEMSRLRIAQGASVVETVHDGPVVAIVLQHVELKCGKTIHLKEQPEHFGMIVNDTS